MHRRNEGTASTIRRIDLLGQDTPFSPPLGVPITFNVRLPVPRVLHRAPTLVALVIITSALVLAGSALILGREIAHSIATEARNGAVNTAAVFTRLTLEEEEYHDGQITQEGREDIQHNLGRAAAVVGVTLWTPERRVEMAIGDTEPQERRVGYRSDAPALVAALAGQTRAALTHGARDANHATAPKHGHAHETFSVYVPIELDHGARPAGALEVYLPYAPVAAKIKSGTRTLYLTLGIATLLIYLALLPTMLRASRALSKARDARHLALQRDLRRAMAAGELELHYQPKVGLGDRSVDGVEALLRWRHPKRGMVPPLAYLPQIEGTPLIGPLGLHVFALACWQAADWRRAGIQPDIAVNMSVANLEDPDLPWKLAEILDDAGLEPSGFTLEVTETAIMQGTVVTKVLLALRKMGFRLSVDDFGTGYSSLARLDQLPVDELKIDRSFTRALERDGDTRVIASMIALAQELELRCVAEGIESPDTADRLARMGCHTGQGFYWARPLPADELADWLQTHSRVALPAAVA